MSQIIKKRNVRLEESAEPDLRENDLPENVRLVHEAGVVRAIEVRCACGESIVVELEYDEVQGQDQRT